MGVLTYRAYATVQREGRPPIFLGAATGDDHVITLDGDAVDDRDFEIGTETTKTLWDATSSPVSALGFLWIETDYEIVVELQTDANAGVGKEVYTITVVPGVPLCLGSNQSYANYTTNFAGGTLDVIDKILARNLSTEDTARTRILVAN